MSESPTAVAAVEPPTIVIERRWAIIGGAVIAALILGLGVALAFTAGDDHHPDGPPGFGYSMPGAEGGQAPGLPPGAGVPPQGAIPQAPGGYPPGAEAQPVPPQGIPAPPGSQGRQGSGSQGGQGSGQ